MSKGTAVFLDTSIQIARLVHSPQMKQRIRQRLAQFDIVASGLVARQEFKRRLLKEAKYLLRQLEYLRSFEAVGRHVIDVLTPRHQRKRTICLEMLQTITEENDKDRTDRAKIYLRSLLRHGLNLRTRGLDHESKDSGCACGKYEVRPKKGSADYDFGPDKCSQVQKECGVRRFLQRNRKQLELIKTHLENIQAGGEPGQKSRELQETESFIESFLSDPGNVEQKDPCWTVGDLLTALESRDFPWMYTLNGKESQHFCRVLGQSLIVTPKNPDRPDIVCAIENKNWHKF